MGKTVVKFDLTPGSIEKAKREVQAYKREIERKTELLRKRIAERIMWSASEGFKTALADDWLGDTAPAPNVTVDVKEDGDLSVVFTDGEDAVFIEFGAGVYHNGSVGGSPHPKGTELGATIGGYGKGHGARKVWGFLDGDTVQLTHGTPAAMPMYKAAEEARNTILEIAREVFR